LEGLFCCVFDDDFCAKGDVRLLVMVVFDGSLREEIDGGAFA
jgi:hypothetical protein